MARPNFYLKSQKTNPSHIIMIFHHNNGKLKYYTGKKVNPNYFSSKNLVSRKVDNCDNINQYLERIRTITENINMDSMVRSIRVSNQEYRSLIDNKLGRNQKGAGWYDYANNVVYKQKLQQKSGDDSKIKGFKSRYTIAYNIIGNLDFQSITKSSIIKIQNTLLDQNKSPGYVNKITKTLISIIRHADKNEIKVSQSYKKVDNLKAKPKDQIFCTIDELEQMYYHDYQSARLRNAANIFLVGAFTSLRVSEFMKVVEDPHKHIVKVAGIQMIKVLSTDKTKKKVSIPLHHIIKDMYEKYDVHPISDVNLNKYIKEVAKAIGMTQDFTRIEYKGRSEIKKTYKRYELISSHTARRSFVTILYMMKVNLNTIRMFTTHSTEKQLLQYMKMNTEMNAIEMADHPFFKPRLKKVD